ncbi:MAG: hypothetical protein PF549_03940 [Patescibacteria group bacterium]|jgi:hypothetical protein|nr:hypothetical protein [Patescibacteria group bacterium]
MINLSLTREMLNSIIRWQNQNIVVYGGSLTKSREMDIQAIVSDMLLLKKLGINMIFISDYEKNSFIKKIIKKDIDLYEVKNDKELTILLQKLKVIKLFILSKVDGIFTKKNLIWEMTDKEAEKFLKKKENATGTMRKNIKLATQLCRNGTNRIHFVNSKKREAFLKEFLTSKGSGTMIYSGNSDYKTIRSAVAIEADEIVRIIRNSLNISISEEFIVREIKKFIVFAVDGYPHSIMMIDSRTYDDALRLNYIALSGEFELSFALIPLVQYAIEETAKLKKGELLIPAINAPILIGIQPWFLKSGFKKESRRDINQKITQTWVRKTTK